MQITDPYIELRTGPGRGYPVFFVAGRDEWIEILLRQTDWFKVRTANGQEGWVNRAQLETTLTEAGTTQGLPRRPASTTTCGASSNSAPPGDSSTASRC